MPKGYPNDRCVVCKRPPSEVGPLSARYKCEGCAQERIAANHIGLRTHSGPWFHHWRMRSLAALGIVVLDETRERV